MEFKYRAVDRDRNALPSPSSPLPRPSPSAAVTNSGHLASNSLQCINSDYLRLCCTAPYDRLRDDFKSLQCAPSTSSVVDQVRHHESLISQEILRRKLLEEEIRRELEIEYLLSLGRNRTGGLFSVEGIPIPSDGSLGSSHPLNQPRMADKDIMPLQDAGISKKQAATATAEADVLMPLKDVKIPQPQGATGKADGIMPSQEAKIAEKEGAMAKPDDVEIPHKNGATANLNDMEISRQQGATADVVVPCPTAVPTKTKKRKADKMEASCNSSQPSQKGWSCDLCEVTATSKEGLDQHLKGKKHKLKKACPKVKKTVPSVDNNSVLPKTDCKPLPMKVDENETPQSIKKDWSCFLCQLTLNSQGCLDDHLKGKKHKAKEAKLKGSSMTVTADSDPCSVLKEDAELFPINKDEKQTGTHGKDKPRVKKVKIEMDQEIEFLCELCDARCNSEASFLNHTAGKKHQAQLAKFEREIKDNDTSTSADITLNCNGGNRISTCTVQKENQNTDDKAIIRVEKWLETAETERSLLTPE